MPEISLRKYAESRKARGLPGGSLSAVQRAVAGQRVTLTAAGKIDPVVADRQWLENSATRPDQMRRSDLEQTRDGGGLPRFGDPVPYASYEAADDACEALMVAAIEGDASRVPGLLKRARAHLGPARSEAMELLDHVAGDVVASLKAGAR